jgi:hypothetical protein
LIKSFLKTAGVIALTVLLASVSLPGVSAQSQSSDQAAEKIKAKVTRLGEGKDITLTLLNGDVYHGSIRAVEDNGFKLFEVDMNQVIECKYSQARKIESGYGHSRDMYGRRIPPRKHWIGLILAAAVLAVPLIIVGTASN